MIFGVWNSKSAVSLDFRDSMEAFSSEGSAKQSLKGRQNGLDRVSRVEFDREGYATILEADLYSFLGEEDDYIDLFYGVKVKHVESSSGREWFNWIIDDSPYARLYFGPRGGVRKGSF